MSLITTPFDATSTAAEVVAGIDLSGRTAVVTGAASGIGVETARALASTGAAVTLAVRDVKAGARAAADIKETTGNGDVYVSELDLADIASVNAFLARWEGPLHILVNNAGVMTIPESYTPPGWELQFATNHLGHFALALGMHEAMAEDGSARIVCVSSSGHGRSPIVFNDLFFRRRGYDAGLAYGQSKTANVLFAVEASKRWASDGITANAVMPGAASGLTAKTPEQGAATSVLLATWPALEGIGGRYFEDCHEAKVVTEIENGISGVRSYALDPANARRLWGVSLHLLSAAR